MLTRDNIKIEYISREKFIFYELIFKVELNLNLHFKNWEKSKSYITRDSAKIVYIYIWVSFGS